MSEEEKTKEEKVSSIMELVLEAVCLGITYGETKTCVDGKELANLIKAEDNVEAKLRQIIN